MRRFFLRIVALGASLACLAACGTAGLNPTAVPGTTPLGQRTLDAKSGTYVYTCQYQTLVDCLVYQKNKIVRTLKTGLKKPAGVVAGVDGLLYVADENAKKILVYSAGAKKLMRSVSDGADVPVDVAVYKDELAVANQKNMTFFAKGAKKPTATLKDSRAAKGVGAAFDSAGNCYFSFTTSGSGAHVDEFKGCKGKGQDLNISPGSPYGIAFDGKDNLYYASFPSSANGVYKCTGVTSCKQFSNIFYEPQYLNFSESFTELWVSDAGNYSKGAFLDEFNVANGKLVDTITQGLSFFNQPSGVAPGPGSL
ncbi:MAG TPA: hypothetical protein VGI19_05830 [Candidatus Cybelea sp.]|jgi:hypothetical protein